MRSKRSAEASAAATAATVYDDRSILETDTYLLLADLDGSRRTRIGTHLKVAGLTGRNSDDAKAIALVMLAPERVESLWTAADALERVLLRAASATPSIGRGTLTRCALDRRHSPAEIDVRIARLERDGILLWREVGFSPAFHVPSEIAARLKAAALVDAVGPQAAARPEGPIADHGGAFLDDLVTALGFLKRGSYRVTRSGAVHAADLRRLASRFVYPEDVDQETNTGAEAMPSRLGLILDLVRRLLLVRFDPDDVRVDDRRARSWLDRAPDEIRRDLIKAARREPWRYQREVSAVADFLSERKPGEFIYVEDVARALEYHPDFLGSRPEHLRARVQAGATFLCFLGVTAVSPQEIRPDAVAITPTGKRLLSDDALPAVEPEEPRITVLPTMEVMMPSAAPLLVRYALEIFADPENSRATGRGGANPVRTYRLEKRTLLQALKGGSSLANVQAFLAKYASEVPDNVRISLDDWSRAYGEYYFMNPTLLVCRDAAAAAAAKSDPKIAERLLGQISPEVLILSEGSVEPVRASLEGNGSMPRAGIEEVPPSAATDERNEKTAAITRFVLKRATDRAMDEERTNPSADSLTLSESKGSPSADAPSRPDRTLAIADALRRIRAGERPADAPSDAAPSEETEDRRKSKLCDVTGCGRQHAARGLCTLHYQAARRGKIGFPST